MAICNKVDRWHSPRDCVESTIDGKTEYTLSERMRSDDNIWNQLWKETLSVPVSNQRQLFDCTAEVLYRNNHGIPN